MAKLKTLILMFVLLSTTTFCYSNWTNPQDNGDGTPIYIKQSVGNNNNDRGISARINGHNLSVSFTENIGDVDIEIENVEGIVIEYDYTETPSGYLCYIPLAGRYIVSFTLSNGDKYIGEFEVTD